MGIDPIILSYLLVAAALVASPGPDSLLIIKNTIISGKQSGVMTVAGVQAGLSVHALLSVIGLSILLYYSPVAFRALAFAGACYLFYLGYKTIVSGMALTDAPRDAAVSSRRAFLQGMLCNVLNPKVIVLFVVLMPTFVNFERGNPQQQLLLLAALLLAINIPFQLLLVFAAARAQLLLSNALTARVINYVFGGILIWFALLLFVQHVLKHL